MKLERYYAQHRLTSLGEYLYFTNIGMTSRSSYRFYEHSDKTDDNLQDAIFDGSRFDLHKPNSNWRIHTYSNSYQSRLYVEFVIR